MTIFSQKVGVALGPLVLLSTYTRNLNPRIKWSALQANNSPYLKPRLILKDAPILLHCMTYILRTEVFTSYFTFHLSIRNCELHVYVSFSSTTRERTSYQGKSKNVKQSRYRPRGFREVKVPRFRDNGTGWW